MSARALALALALVTAAPAAGLPRLPRLAFRLARVVIVAPFVRTITTDLNGQTSTAGGGTVTIRGVPSVRFSRGKLTTAMERDNANFAF